MILPATYINLKHRTDRNAQIVKDWSENAYIKRFEAIKMIIGGHGIYESHRAIIKHQLAYSISNPIITMIMEDDNAPCKNFPKRLEAVWKELPKDWDVLMLGFFCSQMGKFEKVSNLIAKAKEYICGTHCYMINPKSNKKILEEFDNPRNENNIDILMFNLQKEHNVYMAVPTLCYQRESFSDNSMTDDGGAVSKGTKIYFEE